MNVWIKRFIFIFFLIATIVGFMVKLPSNFRQYDKELHSLFYFGAAAFLNVLFTCKNIPKHLFIFFCLLFFSICIEFAQEYSNKFFHARIHGRFDIEDVRANLIGLLFFSAIWLLFFLFMKTKKKNR